MAKKRQERIAVFPGSFDPFTIGHESIVKRAVTLFDKIIIAIGQNPNKAGFFPLEKRIIWIERTFVKYPTVEIMQYNGLTVDFCNQHKAKFILRGLRTSADFEYERAIGQVNKAMNKTIETIYFLALPEHTAISSSIVREVIRHGGNASKFVPKEIDL